ncbi:Sulfatase [Lachnospiraceae bacterium XBB2008]|nr:Sulfatase [Lachnospiraceae bacterium XBB2008]
MIFSLIILYCESVFKIATRTEITPESVLINVLFSLCYGAVISILCRSTRREKVNRVITGVILFVIPAVYSVEFFVYRSFNVFYDINTVFNGAGGALTHFGSDIMRLIVSPAGIALLIFMFAPFFAYIIAGRKKLAATRFIRSDFVLLMISAFVFFMIARARIAGNESMREMYGEGYSFQNAVVNFGFATGVRLDCLHLKGGDDSGFVYLPEAEDVGTADSGADAVDEEIRTDLMTEDETAIAKEDEPVSDKEEEPAPEPEVREYGVNALDIDFEALAEEAGGKLAEMDRYVSSIRPSKQNEYTGIFKGKNLIFFTAEAFSGYLIDPDMTPTLYRLATKGMQFTDFYQPAVAGTTGGEYENLFGMIPTSGGRSMDRMTAQNTAITIANRLGDEYYGKAYHNNTYTVYNRDETHNRLGYSEGFMGVGNGMEEYLPRGGFPASDLEMVQGTLTEYIDKQPFDIYYMTVSGHGQYGRSINQMSSWNYHRVADIEHSEIVKCYLANNLELEDALTYLVSELERTGIADDTVIVLCADHFPYNLDTGASPGNMPNLSELYGFDVTNYLERDSNRLIIWSGCLEDEEPIIIDEPVFSLDILPTLCNLFGVEFDSRLLPGRDVFSDREALVFDGNYDWKTTYGTYISSRGRFIPASEDTELPEDYIKRMQVEVSNRMKYCKNVLEYRYFDHVFGTPEH